MRHATKQLGITGLRGNKLKPGRKGASSHAPFRRTKVHRGGKQFRLPPAIRHPPFLLPVSPQFAFVLPAFVCVCGENNNKRRPNGSQTMSKHGGNDRAALRAT